MKAQLHGDKLGPVKEHGDLSTVVVFDDYDNPILIVKKFDQGRCVVYKANDAEFPKMIEMLGLIMPTVKGKKNA